MEIPEKCSECKGKLNVWTGSHTCVRSASLVRKGRKIKQKVKWICTDCFKKILQ